MCLVGYWKFLLLCQGVGDGVDKGRGTNMKSHKNALSRTTLLNINASKYGKIKPEEFLNKYPDLTKVYDMKSDGWRKKRNNRNNDLSIL